MMKIKMLRHAMANRVFDHPKHGRLKEQRLYEKGTELEVTDDIGKQLWLQDSCEIIEGETPERPPVEEEDGMGLRDRATETPSNSSEA